ncbi:Ras- protein Rab-8B [Glugoides intestinalis]
MNKNCQYIFKVILIGDSGVGKTSLMTRFADSSYDAICSTTIGVDFKIKTIEIDGVKVKLQVWDTAGQERFRAIVSNYYRGAQGIFVVFDMLNKESFNHLNDWFLELEKKGATKTAEIMVLGNKVDNKECISVDEEDINRFLIERGISADNFMEVSAKTNIEVEESFIKLTKKLIEKHGSSTTKQNAKSAFMLREARNKKSCC